MKFKALLLSVLSIVSAGTVFADTYKVTITPFSDDDEGAMAYISNYDSGEKIDSVLIEDGKAVFTGTITAPLAVRLSVDGARGGQFFLEEGELTLDPTNGQTTGGGKVTAAANAYQDYFAGVRKAYNNAGTQAEQKKIVDDYEEYTNKVMLDNIDNPFGYMLFMQSAYDMAPEELEAFIAKNPSVANYKRVQKLIEANRNKAATGEGGKFADFEIDYDGVKHRLSDVVGKGDYVLVDFWASWCGPCIRQTAVIKDIYNQYKDKGLKVLGVAVWDEPENTKAAIAKHDLPWECWLNGQNVPTDIYGISGIPCIILFGPDGTILSRDKQSDELKAAVATAMDAE